MILIDEIRIEAESNQRTLTKKGRKKRRRIAKSGREKAEEA